LKYEFYVIILTIDNSIDARSKRGVKKYYQVRQFWIVLNVNCAPTPPLNSARKYEYFAVIFYFLIEFFFRFNFEVWESKIPIITGF